MITRTPFLTTLPVVGQFRYRDTLQIIPSKSEDPCPPFQIGWYGGTLAVSFDEHAANTRPTDFWAHDYRERDRFVFLKSKTSDKDWLNAVIRDLSMNRRPGIEKEALNLLQVISNNVFRIPDSGHDWFLDQTTKKVIFGQKWHPSFVTDNWGSFWEGREGEIQLVDPKIHFGRLGIGQEDTAITLPSNVGTLLDTYFSLASDKKVTFEQACNLFRSAQGIWPTSKSLALAAYVFAIDALCHADDPKPARCTACGNLQSDQTCTVCGSPKFGITRRFRDFVSQFVDDSEEQQFADRLFAVRSDIAHRGELLRIDEYGTEFNIGGKDEQHNYSYGVGRITRKVLVGWLSNAQTGPAWFTRLIRLTRR